MSALSRMGALSRTAFPPSSSISVLLSFHSPFPTLSGTCSPFSDLQISTNYTFFLVSQTYTRNLEILRFPQAELPNSKNSEIPQRKLHYAVVGGCGEKRTENDNLLENRCIVQRFSATCRNATDFQPKIRPFLVRFRTCSSFLYWFLRIFLFLWNLRRKTEISKNSSYCFKHFLQLVSFFRVHQQTSSEQKWPEVAKAKRARIRAKPSPRWGGRGDNSKFLELPSKAYFYSEKNRNLQKITLEKIWRKRLSLGTPSRAGEKL